MRRFFKTLLCLTIAWQLGRVPLGAQQILTPSSSVVHLEDAGLFAHTNTRILLHPGGGLGKSGGMNPTQIRSFYKLPPTGGQGVIAIVDAYDYPVALADFNTFASQYGLPLETSSNPTAASNQVFQVVYASGTQPPQDTDWNQEAALDIEWAHALAPLAKIVLVEAASNGFSDLFLAVAKAAALPGVQEISMSWGSSEFSGEASFDATFNLAGPAFFASTGDQDFASYPACSAYVVGVGGTSVATSSTGAWTGESAWYYGGGGPSLYEAKPSWQTGVTMSGTTRGIPDLSADADPNTGVSIYDSVMDSKGNVGWMVFGGTSVSSPCMAAMVNVTGGTFTSTTQLLTNIYNYTQDSPYAFRDITAGTAGALNYPAGPGWDYATGVGAPQGGGSFGPLTAAIPVPGASVTVPSGASVAFTGSAADLAPSATVGYAWTFGDGGTAAGSAASHTFYNPSSTTAATYPVILKVNDNNGATGANACVVTVNPFTIRPAITLPAASPTIASGATVSFTGTATDSANGTPLSYAWAFGDGSTGTGATATHAFANPGNTLASYTVTFTVTDTLGGSNFATLVVKVNPDVVTAAITAPAADLTVASGASVNFTGTGTDSNAGATLAYAWTFGDLGTATGASASHTFYNATGANVTYPVTLQVTDSNMVAATSAMRSVTVTSANTLTAVITAPATDVTVANGTLVTFAGAGTDSSGTATILYAWTFGDGTSASGASTSHTFNNPGSTQVTYTVTFTTSDATGGFKTATRLVKVNPNTVTAAITSPGAGTTVASGAPVAMAGTFTDSSSTATVNLAWNFGDGNSGTGATPTHTYVNLTHATVVYTLTLTATDNTGVTASATRALSVTPANLLTAAITTPATNVTVPSGASLMFAGTGTDSSGTATILYGWTFGDGASGTGANVSHTFLNPGTTPLPCTVTLTTSDATGGSATATRSLSVNPDTLTASITAPVPYSTQTAGLPVVFTASATDSLPTSPLTYAWTFGDGTGSGPTTTHTFTNGGTTNLARTVTLVVTDGAGVTASTTLNLTIAPDVITPTITAPVANASPANGVPVVFNATATDSLASATLSYSWNFGDATAPTAFSATPSASHTFATGATATTYTVTLTVMDNNGVTASTTCKVTVSPDKVTATIAVQGATPSAANGVPVTFTASATDSLASAALTYSWNFGDGTAPTSPGSSPTTSHTFTTGAASTTFTVTLTVTDSTGVSSTATCAVLVAPDAVTPSITQPASDLTVPSGTTLTFTGAATDSYAAATLTYGWTFGDGGTASGLANSHTFTNLTPSNVVVPVTLTVTDSTGVQTTALRSITVEGVVFTASSGQVGLLTGGTAVFSAAVTGAANAAVIWTTSPGSTLTPSANGATATFTAPTAGTYKVTVTAVFDPADTSTITVNMHDPDVLGSGTGVTGLDILAVVGSLGSSTAAFDLNGDGLVNGADLAILLSLLGW